MKLLKEDIQRIIQEELENVLLESWFSQLSDKVKSSLGLQKPEDVQKLPDPMRRKIIKGFCAIGVIGLSSACSDVELHHVSDENKENMNPPGCLGKIDLVFRHYNFGKRYINPANKEIVFGSPPPDSKESKPKKIPIIIGIAENEFLEKFKGIEGVEVRERDTGSQVGHDNDGTDHSIRLLFPNVPFDSPSIDYWGIKRELDNMDLYRDLRTGDPFLIRSIAFYFPVKDGIVYANAKQFICNVTHPNLAAACDHWDDEGMWDFTAPIGTPHEDHECEQKYREYIEGPLEEPERKLNETKRSKLRNKSRKSNRRKIRRKNRPASTKRLG